MAGRSPVTSSAEDAATRASWRDADHFLVTSVDGSDVAVRTSGQGSQTPVLLVNAVGVSLTVWSQALAILGQQRKWVSWDLRGLLDSPAPLTELTDPSTHAADAIAVMDHLRIEEFAIVSWSNGSRIALELAARYPGRVRALAIVNGGYGQSLASLLRNLEPAAAMPLVAGFVKHFSSVVGPLFRQLVSRPELAGLIRQSGMLAASGDPGVLIEMLRAMADCDFQRLLASYEGVSGSSAADLVPSISTPTLLITGGQDRFSSRHIIEEMKNRIPEVRMLTYDDGTHYLPMEYPVRLAGDLSEFLSAADRESR